MPTTSLIGKKSKVILKIADYPMVIQFFAEGQTFPYKNGLLLKLGGLKDGHDD